MSQFGGANRTIFISNLSSAMYFQKQKLFRCSNSAMHWKSAICMFDCFASSSSYWYMFRTDIHVWTDCVLLCMFAIVPDMPLIMQCCHTYRLICSLRIFWGFFLLTDDSWLPSDKMKFIYKVHTICRNQYAQGVSGIGWWLKGQTTLNYKLFHGPLHSQLFPYNLSEVWEPCIKFKTKAITHWHRETAFCYSNRHQHENYLIKWKHIYAWHHTKL